MEQVHKRFTTEQVRVLLKGYCQEALDKWGILEILGINMSRHCPGEKPWLLPHPRKEAHDREVITTAIGALIQHRDYIHGAR